MGKYSVIYADPPWSYNDKTPRGAAEKHYPTQGIEWIRSLPVADIAADDALLFLWVTWPTLLDGLSVFEPWGFLYKTQGFTWVKTTAAGAVFTGMGRYTRGNSEVCLIGTRGKSLRLIKSHAVRSAIIAPRGAHSAKPAEVRDRIVDLVGDVPRIELFARERVDGWDAWGNDPSVQELSKALTSPPRLL